MVLGLALAVGLVLVLGGLVEYRLRSQDDLILSESAAGIRIHSGMFYPRHLCLKLKRTTHPMQLTVNASAVGNLDLRVKVTGTVAPSLSQLKALVRAGGWSSDAVRKATQEIQVFLEGAVKGFTERHEIGAISSQKIQEHLQEKAGVSQERFGLEVISLSVQSVELLDIQIAEALRRQEQARILEQTEVLNQQARINATRAKVKADEEIAALESEMDIKKAEFEKRRFEQESSLANQRLEEELHRSRLRLQFEKEEIEILRNSPELLMLTPQAARLAESSQKLKNARTIVSLSPQELMQGSEMLELFQGLLQKAQSVNREQNP